MGTFAKIFCHALHRMMVNLVRIILQKQGNTWPDGRSGFRY